jgi:hypothetical protein
MYQEIPILYICPQPILLPNKMQDKNKTILQYAGLATQFAIAISLAVFIGIKVDKWMALKTPMLTWILPLVFIVTIIYKIVKDTTPKKK